MTGCFYGLETTVFPFQIVLSVLKLLVLEF